MRSAVALVLLLGSLVAHAVAAADDPATATVVLKAAHMFDGMSGRLRDDGAIVIRGERIVAVGSSQAAPATARVIDLGDATLLPGFIDSHVHLGQEMQSDYHHGFYDEMLRFPVEQAHYAAAYAKRTLEAGFTTVRNVGARDFIDVGLRNAINAGIIAGPRMLTAGHAIGSTGGHCDGPPFPPEVIRPRGAIQGVCNGAEDCRAAVRYQLKWGADVIKLCASGGVLSESDPVDVPQLTPAELSAIVSEAHAWKRKVAAHSHGDVAARLAVEAGVDSVDHGTFLSEPTLRLMKDKGVYLVPVTMPGYWVARQLDELPPAIRDKALAAIKAQGDTTRTAQRIGVPIAFGTDSGVSPHGINAKEFSLLVELGMSPSAALLSGTREAAKLLGVDAEVGTLEPGKFADVVAVRGNVLANIAATETPLLVMKQGRLVVGPP